MSVLISSVNEHSFDQEVLAASAPVLVHFWAPWCGLCRFIQPLLNTFQADHPEIKLVGINADDNLKLASTYRLKTLPTLVLVRGGEVVFRQDTFRGRDELRRVLEQLTTSYTPHLEMELNKKIL
jgi:thioredoxin 1